MGPTAFVKSRCVEPDLHFGESKLCLPTQSAYFRHQLPFKLLLFLAPGYYKYRRIRKNRLKSMLLSFLGSAKNHHLETPRITLKGIRSIAISYDVICCFIPNIQNPTSGEKMFFPRFWKAKRVLAMVTMRLSRMMRVATHRLQMIRTWVFPSGIPVF